MMRNCFRCRKSFESDSFASHCEECMIAAVNAFQKIEDLARTVACPSCPAVAGEACSTGSGTPRSCAHVTREKLSRKKAKGAQ